MVGRRSAVKVLARRYRRRAIGLLDDSQKLWLSEARHGEHPWQQRMRSALHLGGADGPGVTATGAHDSLAAQAANLDQVRSLLREAGIEFVELPRRRLERARLVVPQAQIRRVIAALSSLEAEDGWSMDYRYHSWAATSVRRQRRDPFAVSAIVCHRRVLAPNGRLLSAGLEGVTIEAWSDLGPRRNRVDGSTHLPGTLHRIARNPRTLVEYFTPETWDARWPTTIAPFSLPPPTSTRSPARSTSSTHGQWIRSTVACKEAQR